MNFSGHKMIKLSNDWVFDMTEFICYRVKTKDSKVVSFKKEFRVKTDLSKCKSEFTIVKYNRLSHIPGEIIQRALIEVSRYKKDAILNEPNII